MKVSSQGWAITQRWLRRDLEQRRLYVVGKGVSQNPTTAVMRKGGRNAHSPHHQWMFTYNPVTHSLALSLSLWKTYPFHTPQCWRGEEAGESYLPLPPDKKLTVSLPGLDGSRLHISTVMFKIVNITWTWRIY